MKVTAAVRERILELDRRYRSTWDAHAIAHVVGLGHTTVAKILREFRGPRPKRAKQPHTRRTKFLRRDVMWSSDFVDLLWGWKLIRTNDEMAGYRLGWDLCRSETADAAVRHARSIVERMGRAPLIWKYDHGSAFTSDVFQDFLRELRIVCYPTQRWAPWTNGRTERDHQDIHTWLIALEGKPEPPLLEIERDIDEGMLTFNFIKPRASLGFRKSAQVYFSPEAALYADEAMRGRLAADICHEALQLGAADTSDRSHDGRRAKERLHRKSVRRALQRLGLYEEWDVAAKQWPSEAESVNRTADENVSF